MKKQFYLLAAGCLFGLLILANKAFSHNTEIAYCYDCNGNLTIYIDQWHGTGGPLGTNGNTLKITVNGTATTYNNMTPNGTNADHPGTNGNGIISGALNTLPGCQGARQLVGQCQQNNTWDVYYFPGMPRGVPITIQQTGSSNLENGGACGAFSNIATFYIPIEPIALGGGSYCINQSTHLSVHTTMFQNTIYQSNGTTVISHPLFDTAHTVQWQSGPSVTGPWTNLVGPGANAQVLPLGPLQVIGTVYYQALYISSATMQIIPAHDDTVQAVTAQKPDGTDTTIVPYHINHIPKDTVYLSAGGCPLTSNILSVATFIGPNVKAGTDTTVCSTAGVKQMGSTATAGWIYSWTPTTGLSNAAIANPTASLSTPGNIQYIVSARNPACPVAAYDTANIKVNPIPTATVTGNSTVCKNGTAPVVTFTGANGTPPYTFTYNINGAATQTISTSGASSSTTIAVSTATAGNYAYNLVSVKDNNAPSCSQNQASTATIVVRALPTATVSGTVTKCLNDPNPNITFTGGTTTAPYTFTYSINGGANQTVVSNGAGVATVSAPTNVAGTFTYSLISVQDATAQTCAQAQTGSAVVTVNPLAGSIAGTTTVCQNGTAPTVTFTGGGGAAPYTFSYNINGGANQTATSNGAGVATVIAPAGATGNYTYNLTSVQDNVALSCLSASTITITVSQLPTASISGTASRCINGPQPDIIFTGATTTAPYIFSYKINGGATQTATSDGTGIATVPAPTTTAGTFTYSLISIQDGTTQTCTQTQTGSAVVTINPLSASATGTTTLCKNAASPNITFTGGGGTAPYTFTYDINGGAPLTVSTSGGANTVAIPAPTNAIGTFNYSITSIQDASALSCISLSDATITIVHLPNASIAGATAVCRNTASPRVIFSGGNSTPPYTFTYNINGGANQTVSSVGTNDTVTVAAPTTIAGTFNYALVSVATGCSNVAAGSTTVTITPLPTATIATPTPTICENGTATITLTGAVGTPPFTFTYNLNGGATQTISTIGASTSASFTVANIPGTYNYNLLDVTDAFGCNQTQTGTATIIIDPLPTAAAGGNQRICLSGTATVNGASTTNGSINWTENGFGSITLGATTLTPTYQAGTGDEGIPVTLTMTVTSTNACNPQTATAVYTVFVDSLPLAVAGGTQTICQNASGTVGGAIARYGSISWAHNGSGTLSNVTTLTPTYTASAADAGNTVTLTMTVTSTNSCAPQTATATYTIKVDPIPVAAAGGSSTICQNATATVNGATSTNGSILWAENGAGSITSGITTLTPTYTAGASDAGHTVTLTMTVTSTNTCNPQTATATYTIKVDSIPVAVAGGSHAICQNASYTLANGEASSANGSIFWAENGAGSITGGATTLTPTYTAAATDAGSVVTLTMTVTSTNSCNPQTATAIYTIQVDSIPVAVSGGNHAICQGTSYTLATGEATRANGIVQWTENGAGSITSGATTLTPTYTSTAADAGNTVTLTMTVSSNNTCVGQTAVATYTIKVDSLPIAAAGGNKTICENASVTVSGASSKNGSIIWTGNGTGTLTNTNTLTPTYTATAGDVGNPVTLTMTITSTNTCAPNIATAFYTVHVDPLPVAITPGSQAICANQTATIAGATSANGTISWTHNGTGSITAGTNSTSPTYTAAMTDGGNTVTMTMTVTSINACASQTAISTYPITVNQVPTATIAGTKTVCQNEAPLPNVTFTGSNGTSPFTFTYKLNGGAAQTITTTAPNNSVQLPAPTSTDGIYNYSLISVQDVNQCTQAQSGLTTITVNKLPTASISTSSITACQNDPQPVITFTGANAGNNQYTFNYSINGGSNLQQLSTNGSRGTTQAPTTTPGTYVYKLSSVSYTSGKACPNAQGDSVTVKVNPLPSAIMNPNKTEICKDSIQPVLTFEGSNGTAPYTFTFKVNNSNGTPVISDKITGKQTLQVPVDKAGPYTYSLVSVKDLNGCSQNITGQNTTIHVWENSYASFQISPEVSTILEPEITITDASIATEMWLWSFGDGAISPEKTPESHSYADTGTYTIKLVTNNSHQCKDSTFQTVIIELPYLLYIPNTFSPNDDGANDIFLPQGDGILKFNMKIYDRWGNMIFYTDDITKGWDGRANGGSQVAQIDAYIYVITATDLKKHDHSYRGIVNLIR